MNDFMNHHPMSWKRFLQTNLEKNFVHLFISLTLEFTIPINSSSRNLPTLAPSICSFNLIMKDIAYQ